MIVHWVQRRDVMFINTHWNMCGFLAVFTAKAFSCIALTTDTNSIIGSYTLKG